MNFKDVATEDIRLIILRTLEETNGYSCNESIIHVIVGKFGHSISRDRVKTELRWLEEQGLLSLEEVAGIYVATINQRGIDVATGCATIPGVKRPSPRS
jgi:repressor of nif and glnA expression